MESLRWGTMMISMALAGVASEYWTPRAIGVVAGMLGAVTAVVWAWASWRGRIPEPAVVPAEEERMGQWFNSGPIPPESSGKG